MAAAATPDWWTDIAKVLTDVFQVASGVQREVSVKKTSSDWAGYIYRVQRDNVSAGQTQLRFEKLLKDHMQTMLHQRVDAAVENAVTAQQWEQLVTLIARTLDQYKIVIKFGRICFYHFAVASGGGGGGATSSGTTSQRPLTAADKISAAFLFAFHQSVFACVKEHVLPFVIAHVNRRRRDEAVDLLLLKRAVELFIEVGSADAPDRKPERIKTEFDEPYIQALKRFYAAAAQAEWDRDGGHYTYVDYVTQRILLEQGLVSDLSPSAQIVPACVEVLVEPYMDLIASHPISGFSALVASNRWADAQMTYQCMKRPYKDVGTKKLAAVLEDAHSEILRRAYNELAAALPAGASAGGAAEGGGAASSSSSSSTPPQRIFMETVLQADATVCRFIQQHCEDNMLLHGAVKSAHVKMFETELRMQVKPPGGGADEGTTTVFRTWTVAECLADHADGLLRGEFAELSNDAEKWARVEAIVRMLGFLRNKDVFFQTYQGLLAKRILGQGSPSMDLEKYLISLLRRTLEKSVTTKLEGMIADFESTKVIGDKFTASLGAAAAADAPLNVSVLTAGHWPAMRHDNFAAGGSLKGWIDNFLRFYRKEYSLKKLAWYWGLGGATVTVKFSKGAKEVATSVYQAAILEDLDAAPSPLHVAPLALKYGVELRTLKQHLAPMILAKQFQLLTMMDPTTGAVVAADRTIPDDTSIALNAAFVHKLRKFKLPVTTERAAIPTHDAKALEQDRGTKIDACVVRVMKSRRTLEYRELQNLVIEQLSKYFTPQPKLIKSRVEDLITRSYLSRDEADPTVFHYLA